MPDPDKTPPAQQGGTPQDKADEEVARISRTVVPGADAPSRSGISGPGSGADNQKS